MNIEALGEMTARYVVPAWIKFLVLALLIGAVVWAVHAYGECQYQRGLSLGEQSTTTRWQAKDNTELIAANNEIIRLQNQARNDEALHQQRITKIVDYMQELRANEKAKSDAVINDLAAGKSRLQFTIKQRAAATASQTSASGTSQAGASSGCSDEETTSELPPEIAAALYAEADRADGVAEQLDACQQIVTEDRRVCGVKQKIQE